jgi:hypothetical protein
VPTGLRAGAAPSFHHHLQPQEIVMTRKTSKKTASSRQPKTRRFKLTVEGQPMLVDYTPNWIPGVGEFEFRNPHCEF